jgi:hypothetical protein
LADYGGKERLTAHVSLIYIQKEESGSRMNKDRYSMSFTTGALLFHESIKLAGLYVSLRQWQAVRSAVVDDNLIQARTANTLKRVTSEIISRLKTLSEQEINFLADAEYGDQRYTLWLAVCRRYTFIGDFAVEVVYAGFSSLKNTVTYADYDSFFNKKAEWHSELDRITPATQGKTRQILFKTLQETGVLDKNNAIIPLVPGAAFRTLLAGLRQRERMFFPLADIVRKP